MSDIKLLKEKLKVLEKENENLKKENEMFRSISSELGGCEVAINVLRTVMAGRYNRPGDF